MAGFGQKLRQERESRDFTLAQVAEATRISQRYLQALESDNLSALPGSVFNKGYVRSFAKFIGADPEALVQAYLEEEATQQKEGRLEQLDVMEGLAQAAGRNPRRRRTVEPSRRLALGALAAVVLVALGGWALYRLATSTERPAAVASNTPQPTSAPSGDPADSQTASGGDPTEDAAKSAMPGEGTPAASPPVDDEPEVAEVRSTAPAKPPVDRPSSPPSEPAAEDSPRPPGTDAAPSETAASPPEPAGKTPQDSRPDPQPVRREATPVRTTPPPAASPKPSTSERPETAPRATSEPVATDSRISINEFGVGTGVVDRQLVGRADRFAANSRVWFWNRVLGADKGEVIRHVWLHEGKTVSSIELTLGGSHWRTQSRKTLRAPGRWSVEARDAQNRVLARTDFVCDEPS